MIKIAILASGSGSNAENIIEYFKDNNNVEFPCILTNNPNAYVIERARKLNVESIVFNRKEFRDEDKITNLLIEKNIDLIVLAGFLWLIPQSMIKAFPNKIINIHPALLPKYGGKGMYGDNVHKAVFENKEKESGITIHYVNEKYDDGEHIFQAKCEIEESDTPDKIAKKVHELEYEHFPKIIEKIVREL